MLVVDAVLETRNARHFTAWPIAEPSSDGRLGLSGQLSFAEVGTAIAAIFGYNRIPVGSASELTTGLLEEHLSKTGALIAPGGLRFRDTATGAQVVPGCCCGLEDWREWWDVVQGQGLWLGHDPWPQLEHGDRVIRLRQSNRSDSQSVEIPINELPSLLHGAQQQLSSFLKLVQQWTITTAPGLTSTLAAALDEHLRISR